MPEIKTVTSGFEFVPETAAGDDYTLTEESIVEILDRAPVIPSWSDFRRGRRISTPRLSPTRTGT